MATQDEYRLVHEEIYDFLVRTLTNAFDIPGRIDPESVLSDDLGLEPLEWFRLSDMIADEYGVTFDNKDLTLFDWDSPTVDEFVRMVTVKLGLQPPLDYDAFAKIVVIIENVTGIEPADIAPHKTLLGDLDIDSMSRVEIATQCEDEFMIKITDEALFKFTDIRDIVAYVSSHKVPVAAA